MTSMHRCTVAPIGGPRHAVTFGAQLLKDFQHRVFGRIQKGPFRNRGGLLQQLLGFGHSFASAGGASSVGGSWRGSASVGPG